MKITKSQLKRIIKEAIGDQLPKFFKDIPGIVFFAGCYEEEWYEEGFETSADADAAAHEHDRIHHKGKPVSYSGMRRPTKELK